MIIRHKEAVIYLYDGRIAVTVFDIVLKEAALLGKAKESTAGRRSSCIDEGKTAVIAERQNERGSFGAAPALARISHAAIAERIEDGKRVAMHRPDLHRRVGRCKAKRGRKLAEALAAII